MKETGEGVVLDNIKLEEVRAHSEGCWVDDTPPPFPGIDLFICISVVTGGEPARLSSS